MCVPASRDCVEDTHLSTAETMLDVLRPTNTLWCDAPTAWIFRGQANADWALKAKAVRSHDYFRQVGIRLASTRLGHDPNDHPSWALREGLMERMLTEFRVRLERSGIVIPFSSPPTDRRETNWTQASGEPIPEVFPLMAFAQHHGLPTILLDWTRRSLIGAYFAAADAADPGRRGDATHLAVWALLRGSAFRSAEGPNFYDAPGATNPNLHAQAGVFTYHTAESDPSLEQYLARLKPITGGTRPLRRLTLPVSEAPKLLRLLSYEGIDGASMFPGADGVVRAMRESALWDVPAQ